ncbi:MAG TPA: hypothetical protein PKH29_10195 [Oscillospiraceae bacterium]|nr:hypothetical protein [Oscillospiraceae bacterium]
MKDLSVLEKIKDPDIRAGVLAAIEKNLIPACHERAYPGHFGICADGKGFGEYSTWPGLDSWQIAGAYLLMGMEQIVLGYFDFVEASQREDGNIPFAVWRAEDFADPKNRQTHARGLRYPDDVFEFIPKGKKHKPEKWIGLFTHWVVENPLCLLGTICYPLTAYEIYQTTRDKHWLAKKLPSVERACRYILTKKSPAGLIGGAGFYIELPPRAEWDGITQCYCYKAFNEIAELYRVLEDDAKAEVWQAEADALGRAFRRSYWKDGRFAEYIHPEHGPVTFHGYTDTDFAAIGYGLADAGQINQLWNTLKAQKNFWWGGMPTQAVTMPFLYREWELGRPVDFSVNGPIYDIAAIGRVWFVELNACLKMRDYDRIRESVKLVCQMGLAHDGYWYERYHMVQSNKVVPAGPEGYCEYAAILTRIVLGNIELFI